jgi:pimeloyl-ACP methyl ester carboxylesterase
MNRNLYQLGIFLFAVSVVCGLLQSILHFLLGGHMYYLQPFANWFLVATAISFLSTLILLKYFQDKQYRIAFRAGAVFTLVAITHSTFVYVILILVARQLQGFVLYGLFILLVTGSIFALTLIFSKAGEKPWLKAAGILILILYAFLGSAIAWGTIIGNVSLGGKMQTIEQWFSMVANAIPLLFIANFAQELRRLPVTTEGARSPDRKEQLLIGAGLISVVIVIILGINFTREGYWAFHWNKVGPEQSKTLAKSFETRAHVNSRGDTLHYLLMVPLDYDSSKQYPLVICLHGGPVPKRSRALQFEVPEPAPTLSDYKNRQKFPAFIFVPQAPPGHTWGGLSHLPSVDSLVFETTDELEHEFNIDVKRRYVVGGSMGGYGAWHFIGTRPEMFAGAIPFCGVGDPALAKQMVGTPVWAFHGDVDRNVPVSGSREIIEAIKNEGGNPRYTEFPNVGHNVWPAIKETPGVLDWLFAQKRN